MCLLVSVLFKSCLFSEPPFGYIGEVTNFGLQRLAFFLLGFTHIWGYSIYLIATRPWNCSGYYSLLWIVCFFKKRFFISFYQSYIQFLKNRKEKIYFCSDICVQHVCVMTLWDHYDNWIFSHAFLTYGI